MRAGPPLLALLGVVVVALLALLVTTDASDPFDRAVFDAVRDPSWGGTLAFLRAVTELGSTGAVTVIAGLVLALGLTVGPWRHGVIGAAVIGLASVGVELFKD